MHQSKDNKYVPITSVASGEGEEVRDDVYYYTNQIINIIFLGWPGGKWVRWMPACDTHAGAFRRSCFILQGFAETVISGHGQAMEGKYLTEGLKKLADEFPMIAIPEKGKYVK